MRRTTKTELTDLVEMGSIWSSYHYYVEMHYRHDIEAPL